MKLNIVPARTGIAWVKSGMRTFWRQPMGLSALFMLVMAAISLAAAVPLIGPALALALLPFSTLLMMIASAQAWQGQSPSIALVGQVLRTGRERLRAMLVLGSLYAVGFLVILALTALIDGGEFAKIYLGLAPLTKEAAMQEDFQSAVWLAMALYLPLSLLFWHAPGLVHWHGVPPVKSLFFSWVACMRNLGAFALYGLGWLGVLAVGGLVMGLLAALLTVLGLDNVPGLLNGTMMALALALAAMCFASIVFSFRDCFAAPQATTDAQTPPPASPGGP